MPLSSIRNSSHTIKDPVHGNIKIPGSVLEVVDSPEMQRLRRVSQLGFSSLVYPGANHSRFEHSLGTYFLTKQVAQNLGLEDQALPVAGLLHDVGHLPFSHTTEAFFRDATGKDHEDLIKEKLRGKAIGDSLSDAGFTRSEIIRTYRGPVGKVITGDLGTDRIDYLLRDAHYTGVMFSAEFERILDTLAFGRELYLQEKGLRAAESMLLARFWMYPSVYGHHTTRIAAHMLERSLQRAAIDGFRVEEMPELDDYSLLQSLSAFEPETVERLMNRQLYKRAHVSSDLSLKEKEEGELERTISEKAGCDVIVDIPKRAWIRELDLKILMDGGLKNISEVSTIARTLEKAQWDSWWAGVYCAEENKAKVERAAKRVLEK